MREASVVEKEILETKMKLQKIDESDLLHQEIYKSKLERLNKELDKIKMGPKKTTVVEGLQKGKYSIKNKRSMLSENRFRL